MKRFFKIFNKEFGNINQAALLMGFFTLLSQILALFRDRSIAHFVGPSAPLDAYYAAFRIPDLIYISIASLASITVLIPFIVARMDGDKVTPIARKFLNDIFTVFLGLMIFVSLLAFIFMPYFTRHFIAPGFSSLMKEQVIALSRIMLLSPLLMGLSNLFGTVTQIFRRFFIFSLSPIFYNLGVIFGVVFLYPIFGIYGMGIGVILGALMHFLIQVFSSASSGFVPKLSISVDFKNIKEAVLISFPRTLGLAMNSIALISIISLASYLKSGSISIFNFSYNLQTVPLNIIGVSYAVAAFPTLAKSFSSGRLGEFRSHLRMAGRQIIFWSLPITFLFIVLRAQIVRVILGSGSFSWDNTRLVAASLAIFSVSILAQGMIGLLSRTYYAKGETKRPLVINFFCSISIIILAYFLIYVFKHFPLFQYFIESILKVNGIKGTEVLMLPLAYSIGTIINFILHWVSVKKDFMAGESFIAKTFWESLGASFFIGVVSFLGLQAFSPVFGTSTFLGVFAQGFFSAILGIMSGVVILYLLKNEELRELIVTIRTKFWKARVIVPQQEEL